MDWKKNICKNDTTDKKLISQKIYKQFIQLKIKENVSLSKNMQKSKLDMSLKKTWPCGATGP